MFQATMCPSAGADDCVMLSPRVGICRGYEPIHGHYLPAGLDNLPAATAHTNTRL